MQAGSPPKSAQQLRVPFRGPDGWRTGERHTTATASNWSILCAKNQRGQFLNQTTTTADAGFILDRSCTNGSGTTQSRLRFCPITLFRRPSICPRRTFQSSLRPTGNFSRCSLIRLHFCFLERCVARWCGCRILQLSTWLPAAARLDSLFCKNSARELNRVYNSPRFRCSRFCNSRGLITTTVLPLTRKKFLVIKLGQRQTAYAC